MPGDVQEVRCESGIKFGEVVDLPDGRRALKFKCKSEMCKPQPHAVVFHLFDVETLDQLDDEYLLDPMSYHLAINSWRDSKEGETA